MYWVLILVSLESQECGNSSVKKSIKQQEECWLAGWNWTFLFREFSTYTLVFGSCNLYLEFWNFIYFLNFYIFLSVFYCEKISFWHSLFTWHFSISFLWFCFAVSFHVHYCASNRYRYVGGKVAAKSSFVWNGWIVVCLLDSCVCWLVELLW